MTIEKLLCGKYVRVTVMGHRVVLTMEDWSRELSRMREFFVTVAEKEQAEGK